MSIAPYNAPTYHFFIKYHESSATKSTITTQGTEERNHLTQLIIKMIPDFMSSSPLRWSRANSITMASITLPALNCQLCGKFSIYCCTKSIKISVPVSIKCLQVITQLLRIFRRQPLLQQFVIALEEPHRGLVYAVLRLVEMRERL